MSARGGSFRSGGAFACALVPLVLLVAVVAAGPAVAANGDYPASVVDKVIFGGSGFEQVGDVETDAAGNIYVVGWTVSDDYPQQGGLGIPFKPDDAPPFLPYYARGFATKFDPHGEVIYSTYIPIIGASGNAAAVGPDGSLYVVGGRGYSYNGDEDYTHVLKLDPSGSRVLYEQDVAPLRSASIAVDDQGRAVLAGDVVGAGFPVSPDAHLKQPNPAFPSRPYGIMRLAPGGASQYASYIEVYPADVQIGDDGRVYVCGSADPDHLDGGPPSPPLIDAKGIDGAVERFSPNLRRLEYATTAGGPGDLDYLNAIAVGDDGRVYATGQSVSGNVSELEPLDPDGAAPESVIYAEFSADGSELNQLALMGGDEGFSTGTDVQIAPDGAVVVVGSTEAADFPAHGAPAGADSVAAFAFRVEDRQLTHSTAYMNEFVSTAAGVVPTADGLVHVIGDGQPTAPDGTLASGEAFLTTLRLDPYVDDPSIQLRSRQRVANGEPVIRLRAGAREDVDLRARATLKIRAHGATRTVRLRSPDAVPTGTSGAACA